MPVARDMVPLLEGVRAAGDIGLKGDGGNDDDGRRACNAVVRERHGASPEGSEGQRK